MSAEPEDFLAVLRARFLLRSREDLKLFRAADTDPAEVRARAHQLSGSAGVFGFAEVGEAARAVDEAYAVGQPSQAADLALISALERLPSPA
jgi:HPt (histidine-containing phosphotransfer) domain-containing protein